MRITLVSLYDIHSIAIRTLQAILEDNGYDITSIFFKNHYSEEEINRFEVNLLVYNIIKTRPDFIGFSIRSNFFPAYKEIYTRLREVSDTFVLVGGHHATIDPNDTIKYADAVCVGEGEIASLKFCERFDIDLHNIGNIFTVENFNKHKNHLPTNPLIQDLDLIPLPVYNNKQIYVLSDPLFSSETKMSVLTTRGCFFDCSFCYNESYKKICKGLGRYIRRRSVDNVIEEIHMLKDLFPKLEEISFADNVFTYGKKWMNEFCEKFKKENLIFRCFSHPSMVDEDMLIKMKDAGCHMITIGFQHGSERIRKEYYNRHETNEEIIYSSEVLNKIGIEVRYNIITGLPYETEEDMRLNNKLISKLKRPFTVRYFYLMNHPNTELTNRLLKDGYITEDDIEGNKGSAYKDAGKFVYYK